MTFGDILRELMEENDMNQRELAQQLHISAPALGNYVRNLREPDYETLKKIATYFNVSTDYLLDFHPPKISSTFDNRLLHLFHSMTEEQQEIFLEQGQAFVKRNNKGKKHLSSSSQHKPSI